MFEIRPTTAVLKQSYFCVYDRSDKFNVSTFRHFWGQADGVTTSDTMNSWGASSDRSEVDSRSNSLKRHSGGDSGGGGADRHQPPTTSKTEEVRSGREGESGVSKSVAVAKERRDMLFVSGMMGVKRRSLGTLRYWSIAQQLSVFSSAAVPSARRAVYRTTVCGLPRRTVCCLQRRTVYCLLSTT